MVSALKLKLNLRKGVSQTSEWHHSRYVCILNIERMLAFGYRGCCVWKNNGSGTCNNVVQVHVGKELKFLLCLAFFFFCFLSSTQFLCTHAENKMADWARSDWLSVSILTATDGHWKTSRLLFSGESTLLFDSLTGGLEIKKDVWVRTATVARGQFYTIVCFILKQRQIFKAAAGKKWCLYVLYVFWTV